MREILQRNHSHLQFRRWYAKPGPHYGPAAGKSGIGCFSGIGLTETNFQS